MTLDKETAIEALKSVEDPEIRLDIWTLGLVYEIYIKENDHITIDMTLTTPFCPYAPQLIKEAKEALANAGFKEPEINIVFDPPWEPSEEVKMHLGLA
jgi:metal-sulfur cluster biosynthetic enzyme